ncbi:NAD(P)H-dependent flavin oxidoreductase [Ostreibacterium oceani]|uniref:Propionate 3-nitronate monooxygenase n=1 Tax=Ostreibacterium oceani TaxID=2654998 RepID=A0A6N7EYT4_9GAMM|nr:nitronate monooxygenase [Ostreibacterium oceani]MPV86317.1 hypothetical protein [Ostreibacterium oceani]
MQMQLTDIIGIDLPIFQAPLSLYPRQSQLVSAVSEAGALGVFDTLGQPIEMIREALSDIELQTQKPYAVLMSASNASSNMDLADRSLANGILADARQALALSLPLTEQTVLPDFSDILTTVMDYQPAVIIFQNGLPDDAIITACQAQSIYTMAIASNLLESIAIAYSPIDALILQGTEAAGLHSQFPNQLDTCFFPVNTLLYHALANVPKPIVVWGDMVNTPNMVGALINGASAVMIDTPFWTCDESPIPTSYRQCLAVSNEMTSRVTTLWNGFPSRAIPNAMTAAFAQMKQTSLPPKNQQALLLPIINAAIEYNHSDYLPMWSNLCPVVSDQSIASLCERYAQELSEMIS